MNCCKTEMEMTGGYYTSMGILISGPYKCTVCGFIYKDQVGLLNCFRIPKGYQGN